MTAVRQERLWTVEEYLAFEEDSQVKHEYVGGRVSAMAGASLRHNALCGRLYVLLDRAAGSGPCRPYMADARVQVDLASHTAVYYPDVVVSCDPRDHDPFILRFPKLIVEVLSPSTERVDRMEKFLTYRAIPTLEEYVLVRQDEPSVTVYRRSDNWAEDLVGPGGTVELPSVGLSVPLEAIYARAGLPGTGAEG